MILEAEENTPNFLLDSISEYDTVKHVMGSTINFKVDTKIRKELEKLAKQDRRSLSDYMRIVCERAVEQSRVNDSLKTRAVG